MFRVMIPSLLLASIALAQPPDSAPRYHSSRILVKFKPGVARVAKSNALRVAGAVRVEKEYKLVKGLQVVEVPMGKVHDVISAFLKNPNVAGCAACNRCCGLGLESPPDLGLENGA